MGPLQVFAFCVLGNSEETVGEGVGLDVGDENLLAVGPSFEGAWGVGRGTGVDMIPSRVKCQRPRWWLPTAREDHRGPASPGLRVQGCGSRGRCAGRYTLGASLLGLSTAGQAPWGGRSSRGGLPRSSFPRKVPQLSAGFILGADWGHVALITSAVCPRMAPETAGPGASPEWRSAEAAPKPRGLSARPFARGKRGPPRARHLAPQTRDLCARTHTHAHTLM